MAAAHPAHDGCVHHPRRAVVVGASAFPPAGLDVRERIAQAARESLDFCVVALSQLLNPRRPSESINQTCFPCHAPAKHEDHVF